MPHANTYKNLSLDKKRFIIAIANWQDKCDKAAIKDDMELAAQYEQDIKDLTDVFNAIESEDFETAFDLAEALDTLVRDQIPIRLYNFLAKENGYN